MDRNKTIESFVKFGATEVLEQNTYADVSGFVPTYKILSSYDHLFDSAGYDFPAKKGGLEATLSIINDIIKNYNHQAARIAAHLKADTLEQSAFNIWHFCVNNISYKLDKEGYEELRTPNRTWHDRFTGVDCDDFAIFSSCILLQMGYTPELAVVAFNNNAQFGHIYTVVGSKLQSGPYNLGQHNGGAIGGGIVVDPVLRTIFNKHPKGITKARIMNIQVLNGIESPVINGFGAVLPADATTQKLITHYQKLEILKRNKQATPAMMREMRKLRFMIAMNGMPERNLYLEVMPLVWDIDRYGQFEFISEQAAEAVVSFLDETVGKGLTEYELVYENGVAVPVLKGLGAAALGELGAKKKIFKKLKEKVKAAAKKVTKGVKATATKVKDGAIRYNPGTIAARNGLLLALSVNFRNLARRFNIAFMSATELQAAGYTAADQAKAKTAYAKAEKLFEKIGGKKENLREAIIKGKDKKALFGSPKKTGGRISGYQIEGLGEPVTLAAITAALAPILAFVKMLKESGISFKKNEEDTTNPAEDILLPQEEADFEKIISDNQLGPDGRKSADAEKTDSSDWDEDDESGSGNTLFYVGGGVLLLAILGITMSKKSK